MYIHLSLISSTHTVISSIVHYIHLVHIHIIWKLILTCAYMPIRHNFRINIVSYNTSFVFSTLAGTSHIDTHISVLAYASQITTIPITLFLYPPGTLIKSGSSPRLCSTGLKVYLPGSALPSWHLSGWDKSQIFHNTSCISHPYI